MTKLTNLDKYDTLLDIQKSDTSDRKYEIRWSKDCGYFCECAGWRSSKKKPKNCKHLRRLQFVEEIRAVGLSEDFGRSMLKIAKTIWKGQI